MKMKLPQLEKKSEIKSCHNTTWTDDYSWIHQSNILEVLKDSSKLLPEVRKYLEDENEYFSNQMKADGPLFPARVQYRSMLEKRPYRLVGLALSVQG